MSTCTTSLKVSLVSSCSSAQPVLFTWAEYYLVSRVLLTADTAHLVTVQRLPHTLVPPPAIRTGPAHHPEASLW